MPPSRSTSGVATCATSTLAVGSHSVVATYGGRSQRRTLRSPTVFALRAPTNLTATLQANPAGGVQVSLGFTDNLAIETGFEIQRSTDGVTFTHLATAPLRAGTGAVTFVDTTVTYGTTYTYRVADITSFGNSPFTNTAQVIVPAQPLAPSALTAANGANQGSQRRVVLTWVDNASNETGFTVQRATNAAFTTGVVNTAVAANAQTVTVSGLARNTSYYFRIRANNGAIVSSGWSDATPVSDHYQPVIRTSSHPTPATGRRRVTNARARAVGAAGRLDRNGAHGGRSQAHRARPVVRSPLRAMLLALIASSLVLPASSLMTPGVHAAVPRVVIVVGPAGPATGRYRADGDEAARVARSKGATVTTVYSPDATWPTVKAALQGASIVVYMGHGNGFPSRYGRILTKRTKDGLGLNPVAGVDDVAHQYFGEAYLIRNVRLAPHAVVLLHHLCYASGNSEPGLPEGDLQTGQQRVDNMAAGWLAAGADAVLADAYGHPAHYVGRILAGRSTIEAIWRMAPTAQHHVLAFPSSRTPGMTALMDPTRKSSGFYRSLVVRAQMSADEVAAGAALIGGSVAPSIARPQASGGTPAVSQVTLEGRPIAGAELDLSIVLQDDTGATADAPRVGIRWDPIVLDSPAALARPASEGVAEPPTPGPSAPRERASPSPATGKPGGRGPAAGRPGPSTQPSSMRETGPASQAEPLPSTEDPAMPGQPSPSDGVLRDAEPSGQAAPVGMPTVPALIAAEVMGEVVAVVDVKRAQGRLTAKVESPGAPGLYRLVTSLHDADGVVVPEPPGRPIPTLLVRVMGPLSAIVAAYSHLEVRAGAVVDLPVAVMNSGIVPWVTPRAMPATGDLREGGRSYPTALLIGYWLPLDRWASSREVFAVQTTVDPAPGDTDTVSLGATAPDRPGEYLVVLDVMSAVYGSLTAAGSDPVVIRVSVVPRGAVGGP